jgi:hypothetical protein
MVHLAAACGRRNWLTQRSEQGQCSAQRGGGEETGISSAKSSLYPVPDYRDRFTTNRIRLHATVLPAEIICTVFTVGLLFKGKLHEILYSFFPFLKDPS